MPFPKRLLNSFETVRVDLRPHWWYLTPSVSSAVVSLLLAIWAVSRGNGFGDKVLKIVFIALLLVCIVWAISRYLRWATTYFVVTSDRVIFRQGVLRKVGVQIPLERVNNVNFQQTIFERMLGAGDLLIESGGKDGNQRFTDIKHPDRITNIIHEAMENNQAHDEGRGHRSDVDVADQLERLEGLLNRGAITEDEFEAQKRRLLG